VGVPPEVNNKDILPFFEYYGTVRTFYDVVKPVFFGGRTNQVKNGNRVFILKFFKIIPPPKKKKKKLQNLWSPGKMHVHAAT